MEVLNPSVRKIVQTIHSRASKILIRNKSPFMEPSQGQRAMLGGPEFVFWEIIANGAGQIKKSGIRLHVFLKTKRFFGLQDSQSKFCYD